MTIRYDDFDLQIEPAGEKYRVRLLNAPTGQATTEFVLPFTEIEVANFLNRIGQVRRTMRRVDAPELQAAKEFGGKLFNAVFSGEMIAQLRGSMEQASDKDHGLRIRLRLTDVPALSDLPWEFLYDANQNHFLTTSSETPVVRFLDLPQRIAPLRVALPLRVLVMIASPRNLKRLDTEGEWDRLQESLADLLRGGQIRLERLPSATLDALRLRARGAPFHVFHFIGHGGFDEVAQDGVLQFEDEMGMSYPVRGEMLGMQLHDHRSLRLAVLNACEGARSSRQDPFSGVAQSLLQQRVPAVIAMQFEISDAAAKVFASEFYRAVAEGNPVDAAVCESRKALFKEQFGQEWATPVLYMRSQEGQLFELQAVTPPPPPDEGLKKRQAEEAERLAAAKAEAERLATEKEAAERQAARKTEAERAAKAEKERQELEKIEQERLARDKAEAERKVTAKAEAERQAAQKAEAERAANAEKVRLERERAEQERLALAKAEAARQVAARAEAERAANAEKERQARQAAEKARLVHQQEEAERRVREQAAFEKLQRENAEADLRPRAEAVEESHSARTSDDFRAETDRRVLLALVVIPILGVAVWLAHSYQARRAALDSSERHYLNGQMLSKQKNFEGALAEYREAIRLQPNYADAHLGLGIAFRDKGDLDNADTEFREAIRERPDDISAHEALGLTLFRKGDFDGATGEYRKVARLNPQDADAHYNLAKAMDERGDHDAAIVEYRETLRLKPDFPKTHSMPDLPAVEKTNNGRVSDATSAPPSTVQPAAAIPGSKTIREGGKVQAAKLIERVNPTYPPLAAQARISGTVRLHAIIGKEGTVREVDVLSGHPLLLQSAMNAVRQWRYRPTLLNGRPVEVDTTIEVEFNLTGIAASPGPETKAAVTSPGSSISTPAPPPAAKSPCTFGKIEFSEQGNRLVGTVPYTYQGAYPLDAVALRGIPLNKNRQQISGLTYEQSTLRTASGTVPFAVEGHPTLNHQKEETIYLIISIVVKQTNAVVCGEVVPYQRMW